MQVILTLLIALFDQNAANQFDRLRQIPKLRKIGRADLLRGSIPRRGLTPPNEPY